MLALCFVYLFICIYVNILKAFVFTEIYKVMYTYVSVCVYIKNLNTNKLHKFETNKYK